MRIPAYGFSCCITWFYIVQGHIMRFVGLFTESEIALLHTVRLVNVTFGLLMAVVVYFIGEESISGRQIPLAVLFRGGLICRRTVYAYSGVNTISSVCRPRR